MVIVRPNGTIILESGDPNYIDILQVGPTNPQNELLDADPASPLSVEILTAFNIPFDAGSPFKGTALPGYDIKNQDAITMLKLALITELINNRFVEIEIDEFGVARYYVVGTEAATNIDIRYCVPTSEVRQPIDLVIVRGYDPPPVRELRDSFDGLQNKELMAYEDCAQDSCEESFVSRYATISYDDPLLDQTYLDDVINSYELQAFESLLGYLVDLDVPDGIDDIPGLKITFGDTTKEYIRVPAKIINNTVNVNSFIGNNTGQAGRLGFSQLSNVSTIAQPGGVGSRTGGNVPVVINIINEGNFNELPACGYDLTNLTGGVVTFPNNRFIRENKFGRLESDFIGVVDIVFSGHKIKSLTTSAGGGSVDPAFKWVVAFKKDLISLQHGRNWTWSLDANQQVQVFLFSITESAFDRTVCQIYSDPQAINAGNPVYSFSNDLFTEFSANPEEFICNIGDGLGYFNPGGEMCIVVERRRPSIDIFDPRGTAFQIAEDISITYTPIIIVDAPPPITYASRSALSSIDGTKTIAAEGIIDQSDGIVDADPTTTQDLEDSESSILQDNTDGFTLDITLPFCSANECLTIAKELLALQEPEVQTTSVVMGPDSEPRLGQILPDGSTINEISYQYSDSSQYLITVTAGPKYQTVGSYNNSAYQLQTEDVTRDGHVIQDKGNGVEYVVRVDGFGEITALSMVLDDISVGDKVSIRIYNNPVERI